jgi:CubicO group peptidase (beta-lactamase class C family)
MMQIAFGKHFILACLTFFFTQSVYSSDAYRVSRGLEEVLFKLRKKSIASKCNEVVSNATSSGFSGVVLIAEKGNVVFKSASGFSDVSNRITLQEDDIFQIASVSKQFTAVAILILKERGLLGLDDAVSKHIPNFPYPTITVRHLLSHRSGLPEYRWVLDSMLTDVNSPISNEEMLNYFIYLKPELYFSPGNHFAYSNTGYAILACVIEHILRHPFEYVMQQIIFKPLQMHSTFVYSKCNGPIPPNAIKGYESGNKREAANDVFNGITGDKNIFSNVTDLLKWDQALYSNKLLLQSSLSEAFKPTSPEKRGWKNYGFGWRLNLKNPEKKIVYHSGWWRGFKSYFMRNITDQRTIIILSNNSGNGIQRLKSLSSFVSGEVDSEEDSLTLASHY